MNGPGRVFLLIEDDGGGMADERARRGGGRGLANMRRRAARLGGALEVRSGPGGTRVRLVLPLAAS